jgi:hypothetical protein
LIFLTSLTWLFEYTLRSLIIFKSKVGFSNKFIWYFNQLVSLDSVVKLLQGFGLISDITLVFQITFVSML